MRRRMMAAAAAIALAGFVLAASAQPAYALSAFISKIKSDCSDIQVEATLVWEHDDGGGYDKFRLELYDLNSGLLYETIDEQITKDQSPWFWQTHRMHHPPASGSHYRVVLWDTGGSGNRIRKIDEVYHECTQHSSWRPDNAQDPRPVFPTPDVTCRTWIPFYSTNLAPEAGEITVLYSYNADPETENYFVASKHVEQGEGLDPSFWLDIQCGVYVKLFYQPDSTKAIYFMPSQFYPRPFGTPSTNRATGDLYYTYFPLNSPVRPTPTPTP